MSNIPLRLYAVVPHFASWFIADLVTLLSHSWVLGSIRIYLPGTDGTDQQAPPSLAWVADDYLGASLSLSIFILRNFHLTYHMFMIWRNE